jgi:hypothetical protein
MDQGVLCRPEPTSHRKGLAKCLDRVGDAHGVGAAAKSRLVLPDDTSAVRSALLSRVAVIEPELDRISTGPATSTRVVRPLDTSVRRFRAVTPRMSRSPELARRSTANPRGTAIS